MSAHSRPYNGPVFGCWPIVILILGLFFIIFKYTPWLVYGAIGLVVLVIVCILIAALWEEFKR